jgi:hypothetical protein
MIHKVMKKLLIVGLVILAGSAWAEWMMYFESESITYYYKSATIRKDKNMRRVWRLQELKQHDAGGVKSRRMRIEYDCKEERYRILSYTFHSESMAGGEILATGGEDNNWSEIPPATAGEEMLKIVCAK